MSEKKQHTAEFESCVEQVVKQSHDKHSAFAICTKSFKDAGKPLYVGEAENQKLHLFSESIRLDGNKVSGVAIHPKRIFHPEEGLTHVYLREELEKAAPSLVGKPFGIDHRYVLPPPNVITNAWFDHDEDGVAFEGLVDDKIAEQIRSKAFKGISIELNWLRPGGKVEYTNGVAPRNFELTSVHLLRNFPPGDKDAYIKFWNAIMEQLVQGPVLTLDEKVDALTQRFESFTSWVDERFAKINGVLTGILGRSVECTQQAPTQNTTATGKLTEAEWDTAYINDLPDSAFAVISSGGQKDDRGKTTPRTLRHLPHHKADGSLDLPHLRNALARLPQTDLSSEDKGEAKRHLCAHAKSSEIVSEVCGEKPSVQGENENVVALEAKISELQTKLMEAESPDVVALRRQIVNLEARFVESEKQTKATEKRMVDFHKLIESIIPASGIWKAWTPGPKRMVQELQRVLRESALSRS